MSILKSQFQLSLKIIHAVLRTATTRSNYHTTRMPPKPKANKACSLCHQVCEELKYHYDICEPCHQSEEDPLQLEICGATRRDACNGPDTDPLAYTDEEWDSDDEYLSGDDDVLSEEENDEEVIEKAIRDSRPRLERENDSKEI